MNEEINNVTAETQGNLSEKLLKIAVIGTGNCGCMMANEVTKELGIAGAAINGSKRDLDLLDSPNLIPFKIGDGKGTGKNREQGKKFFQTNIGFLTDNRFTSLIESNDVILILTSTGGGYGSGSSTEIAALIKQMYPEKVLIMVGVLPFESEGYDAFAGTQDWLVELMDLEIGYIMYDNNRFKDMIPAKAAAIIADNLITDIEIMQGDWLGTTFTGGIDERDMLTVLSVPGRIVIDGITDVEESSLVNGSLIETLKQHIDVKSAHAEMVSDKEILASALMYTLDDGFDNYKISVKSDLQEIFGSHVKDMTNFSDDEDNDIAVVLSGLTEPSMVIDRVINRTQNLSDDITSRRANRNKKLSKSKLERSDKLVIRGKSSFADQTQMVNQGRTESNDEIVRRYLDSQK